MSLKTDRPRRHRLLASFAALSLLLTVVGGAYSFILGKVAGIKTLDISQQLGNRPSAMDYTGPTGPLNILVMGTDTRQGQDQRLTGSGGNLSDTTILVHIFDGRKRAQAVSIQRDALVMIPTCDRGNGNMSEPKVQMFNQAYRIGGPACTVKTVESLTNLYIDHFVEVNFNGFMDVVDAVGGVPVCLKDPVNAPKAKLKLPAGNQVLNGFQALGWVRAREGIGDGSDLSRIKRQQLFLGSLVRKLRSSETLTNPVRLVQVVSAVADSLRTDSALGKRDAIRDLALSMRKIRPADVRFISVPVRPYPTDRNRLEWIPGKSKQLWFALKNDTEWPKRTPTSTITIPASGVKLSVHNGSGTEGRGQELATRLRELGYVVTKVVADKEPVKKSSLVYGKGREDSVKTIAAATGLTPVLDTTMGKKIVLTVGPEGLAVTKVSVSKPPTPGEVAQQGVTAEDTTCVSTK